MAKWSALIFNVLSELVTVIRECANKELDIGGSWSLSRFALGFESRDAILINGSLVKLSVLTQYAKGVSSERCVT